MAMPEAKGRGGLAQHLASATTMTPEQIRSALKAAPADPLAQARDVVSRVQASQPKAKVEGSVVSANSHPHLFAAYPFLAEKAGKDGSVVLSTEQIRDLEANVGKAAAAPQASTAGSGGDVGNAVDQALAHYRGMRGAKPASSATASAAAPPAAASFSTGPASTEIEESTVDAVLASLRQPARRRH
ncbi:hypothetical protein MKK67_06795 [Methylobacterium sp. J-072]|uniref:hypothetical protein n=1 Tax=Methylobacterium sp. J-072 TaxID=2836651 RepID=UPI001FBA2AB3|nr:hypothetical protein [Methylobacterium sp. J-072]MCJ2092204.1 hypothetical protein [Methylobacterium sp. J-072]